jgi:hypothetical protein
MDKPKAVGPILSRDKQASLLFPGTVPGKQKTLVNKNLKGGFYEFRLAHTCKLTHT